MNKEPPIDPYASEVLLQIANALPPIERAYALARFFILRMKLLAVMDLLLPAEGDVLDVGCGFGLFASYFTAMSPGRRVTGVDLSSRRVSIATDVARTLSQPSRFEVGDIRHTRFDRRFDAAYTLDVLHHIDAEHQLGVLEHLRDSIKPGGVLIVKDITTEPHFGLLFTKWLDRLVVGPNAPLAYRHHREWSQMLQRLGFRVRVVRVPDVLPYPHIVLAAQRPVEEHQHVGA